MTTHDTSAKASTDTVTSHTCGAHHRLGQKPGTQGFKCEAVEAPDTVNGELPVVSSADALSAH